MAKRFNLIGYIHGHTYYLGGIIAAALSILTLVQAVITQIDGLIYIAALEYFIGMMLVTVAYHYFRRGGKHYDY